MLAAPPLFITFMTLRLPRRSSSLPTFWTISYQPMKSKEWKGLKLDGCLDLIAKVASMVRLVRHAAIGAKVLNRLEPQKATPHVSCPFVSPKQGLSRDEESANFREELAAHLVLPILPRDLMRVAARVNGQNTPPESETALRIW